MIKIKYLFKKFYQRLKEEVLKNIDSKPHKKILPKLEILYNNNPKDVMVLMALTHVYYHKKDYAKAMHYVLNALDANPNDSLALKYKAWIYDETGDKKHYEETLLQIYDAGNADWEVYDELAVRYEQSGHFLKALGLYTLALKDPDNYQPAYAAIGAANCYCNAGAFGIADEIYDTLLDVYPGDGLILHNKANNFYLKGELDKAEKILLEIIAKDPHFEISKLLLGDINRKRNEIKLLRNSKEVNISKELKPSEDINDHVIESPEELEVLLNKSKALVETGDYAGAKIILENIIDNDDSIAIAWLNLAGIYFITLELQKAVYCCDKILLLEEVSDAGIMGAYNLLIQTLYALGNISKALTITDRMISSVPNNYMAILVKARILNRQGDYSGALSILLPVMSIIPPEEEVAGFANYLLATAYYKLGNEAKFIKALMESVRLGCEFGTRWFRTKYATTEDTYKGTTVTKVYERKDLK